MAQWNTEVQEYLFNNDTLFEASMQVDEYGNPVKTQAAASVSAFGENVSVQITPVFQLDGLYGIDNPSFETYSENSGLAHSTGTLMECKSGTSLGGYGVIRSKRAVRYRPGQGALTRFTAQFTSGIPGYTQRAGFFTQEQALQVGYNGDKFGVLLQNGGKAHIHSFQIDTAATSSGDITLTLDGIDYVVSILSGDTIGTICAKINEQFLSSPWVTEYSGNKVCFLSKSVGSKSGSFSFVDTGSTGITSILSVTQEGADHIESWTYQEDFNKDKLDGTGTSGAVIDPSKLNVYQINFRWLGAGELRFAIENPTNGDMIIFHKIRYANKNNDVHLDNPSLKVGYVAASIGGSGSEVSVSGASMMGAIEGLILNTKYPSSIGVGLDPIPNLTDNDDHHVMTIHNRLVYKNKVNTRELLLKRINGSFLTNPSGTPVSVFVYANFEGLGNLVYDAINEEKSSTYFSTDLKNVTIEAANNVPIYVFEVPGGGSSTVDVSNLRIAIPPNSSLSFIARSTEKLVRVAVSGVWVED